MDASQWPQEQLQPMEEVTPNTNSSRPPRTGNMLEIRRAAANSRPLKEQNLNCPRCNSTNTKFCYYNNYSLTQPRYFCKTCRRYWTQGGSLRNVPVGGGSRKNKRTSAPSPATTLSPPPPPSSSTTITASSPSSAKQLLINIPDLNPAPTTYTQLMINAHPHHQKPSETHHHQRQDLNLAFPTTQDYQAIFQPIELPKIDHFNNNNSQPVINAPNSCSSSASTNSSFSALELLRSGISSRGLNPYVPVAVPGSSTLYSSGFVLQEFKPNLSFLGDGIGARVGNVLGVQENNGARLLFPFADMKQISSTTTTTHEVDQTKGSNGGTTEYWNGMFGGGTW